jgi:hypothetical protein
MTWARVPPTLVTYWIEDAVLEATCGFLRDRGAQGFEGVVLWIGEVLDLKTAQVRVAATPEQIAYRTSHGLAVEITRSGLSRVIDSLPPGWFVLARVHTHGDHAFHSEQDDRNMVISHQGAISIVVPSFCADGLDLDRCSVSELHHGSGWQELSREEVKNRFRSFRTKPV